MRITVTLNGSQEALFESLMKLPLLSINKPALVARHFMEVGMMKMRGEAERDPAAFHIGESKPVVRSTKKTKKPRRKS